MTPPRLRLGLNLNYAGPQIRLPLDLIHEAERLGYFAVWTAEAYGSDAVTPLAWIGARTERLHLGTAVMQIPARTPAATAMTALTLDQLSGGRFLLGLGISGPQVVEGWHGQPYARPLARTREAVRIIRAVFRREAPLEFSGSAYQIPYQGADATGLGKPLKSILHGRADIPIYLAAIGPKNVQLAAEIAEGWLPMFFAPRHYDAVFRGPVEAGRALAAPGPFDIAPSVLVALGDDLDECRQRIRPILALYIGGMGAPGKNFYSDLARRYGYADAARTIQALYLAGQKQAAAAAVPDALVDDVALCGPPARIADRLALWRAVPITTLNLMLLGREWDALRLLAELVL